MTLFHIECYKIYMLSKEELEQFITALDARAKTLEANIQAHTTAQIKASEERIKRELKAEIKEFKTEFKELKKELIELQTDMDELKKEVHNQSIEIHDQRAELVKKLKSHERRINTLEDELDIPHPGKN